MSSWQRNEAAHAALDEMRHSAPPLDFGRGWASWLVFTLFWKPVLTVLHWLKL